eukprot:6182010-Pleurochrysis_carterae.AAC.1
MAASHVAAVPSSYLSSSRSSLLVRGAEDRGAYCCGRAATRSLWQTQTGPIAWPCRLGPVVCRALCCVGPRAFRNHSRPRGSWRESGLDCPSRPSFRA